MILKTIKKKMKDIACVSDLTFIFVNIHWTICVFECIVSCMVMCYICIRFFCCSIKNSFLHSYSFSIDFFFSSFLQICETYQIIGSEYKNRLLVLVGHGHSFGVFSFAASKWPPELFSDLTIESVYPLNDDFKLDTSRYKKSIE